MPPSEGEGGGSDENIAVGGGDNEGGGAGASAAQLTRPTPPGEPAPNGDVPEVRRQGTSLPPRLPGDQTSMPSSESTSDGALAVGSSLNLGGEEREKGEGVVSDGGATGGGERAAYSGMVSRFGAYVEALGFGGGQEGNGGDVERSRDGGEKEDAQEHQMKVMFREQQPMPFELAMLEAMLQEVRVAVKRSVYVLLRSMTRWHAAPTCRSCWLTVFFDRCVVPWVRTVRYPASSKMTRRARATSTFRGVV